MTFKLTSLLLALGLGAATDQAQTTPVFRDPSQPFDTRIKDLISKLTLAEKADQLMHDTHARLLGWASTGSLLFPLLVGYLLDLYKSNGDLVGGYKLIFSLCGFSYLLAWGLMPWLAPTLHPVRTELRPTVVLA